MDMNTNPAASAGEMQQSAQQHQEILDFVAFEDSTAAIWPWAASAEEISGDAERLAAVEEMLVYDPQNGYDVDQMYDALDKVFGINPALLEPQGPSFGAMEQCL